MQAVTWTQTITFEAKPNKKIYILGCTKWLGKAMRPCNSSADPEGGGTDTSDPPPPPPGKSQVAIISSSDLKSRPTLIRGHFCLHDVVRETLHCACATVGKKLLRCNLAYTAVKVKILRFKQVTSAKLFPTCSYLHFLLFPKISILKSPFIPQKCLFEHKLLIRLHC